MAVQLNIVVVDIAATLLAGYTHIKVYRSSEETFGFEEVTTPESIVTLSTGVSDYTFIDGTGNTALWYRTTFIDTNEVVVESGPSDSFKGTWVDTNFGDASYPEEFFLTADDYYKIGKIRTIIGDYKELTRDYVAVTTGYSTISADEFTHTLTNPNGWPVKVVKDGTEYITKDEPFVNDYQFITFSGSVISTISGTLDVWYYHFRNSDAEILRVYNGLLPPLGLAPEDVTLELSLLCAAIEILENEVRLFGATSGSEVDIFQEIRINPKGGIDGRMSDLEALRKRKEDMIDELKDDNGGINKDICGVLID